MGAGLTDGLLVRVGDEDGVSSGSLLEFACNLLLGLSTLRGRPPCPTEPSPAEEVTWLVSEPSAMTAKARINVTQNKAREEENMYFLFIVVICRN